MKTLMIKKLLKTWLLSGCFILCLAVPAVRGENAWRTEFDETCSKTTDSMMLSVDELATLIQKCDRLQKAIEAEDETVRKVYLKRLQMCRNLFVFVLDEKKKEQQPK
jgi:hypothetical protein